jgi:N-formylglutamate deformylase
MEPFRLARGTTRLLLSIPHAGTHVPAELARRMTPAARALPDTDWHVERLYDFAGALGATVLVATHSRYVIDVNRPPDDTPLYPGLAGSGLCPAETFAGEPVWRDGATPDAAEIAARVERWWRPYHECLRAELDALVGRHGSAVLWDAHSIASRVPRLFAGELPVVNLGTNDGRACEPALAARLLGRALGVPGLTAVLDGRFKGGYITRHYGDPARGVNAIQLELAQRSYMDEATRTFLPARAEPMRALIRALLAIALE